ncbi:fatty acid desaturase family protein [Bacterioplanes sanyensis]|nr:acyl-CoA desaturase [Bacterioplanes sanyensis]
MNVQFPPSDRRFYQQLSQQVQHMLEQQGEAKTGNRQLWHKALIITAIYVASYLGLLLVEPANSLFWLLHGVATALVGFNIMHDGAHASFSKIAWVNRCAALTFNVIGSHRFYWAQKHNRSHHSFTNVMGVDEDIDAFGLIRMSPHQAHHGFHRYQHLYVWLLYPFTSLFWFFVLDYKAYYREKIATRQYSQSQTWHDHVEFWASKITYLLVYLWLPAQLLGWQTTLLGFLLMHFVLGTLFAVVFQLAHVVEQAEFPAPNQNGVLPYDWAHHQLATTVDFAPNSRWLTWALGGLNFQLEHHLFPRISHVHYPAIHRLLCQCQQAGQLSIKQYPTLGQAIQGHYRHLRQLGHANTPELVSNHYTAPQ